MDVVWRADSLDLEVLVEQGEQEAELEKSQVSARADPWTRAKGTIGVAELLCEAWVEPSLGTESAWLGDPLGLQEGVAREHPDAHSRRDANLSEEAFLLGLEKDQGPRTA